MFEIDTPRRLIAFYLVPDFTMLAFTSAIEVLRLANMALGEAAYSWRIVSNNGEKVRASCGIALEPDSSVAEERRRLSDAQRPHMILVCGGMQIATFADRVAEAWLRECRQRGVALAGLCNGTHVLARAGLLNERRCAIHWENYPGFAEQFRTVSVSMGLFEVDGNIHTCAGGTASMDMMLDLVKRDHGDTIVDQVCDRALIDRVRQPSDRQRRPFAVRMGRLNPTVARVIEAMEDNLSEPLIMDQLADAVKLSRRQIERLFRNEIGSSPVRYYRKLRLDRARLLLIQTTMPVIEVAVASGFVSASHFSKSFREIHGCAPQEVRTISTITDANGAGIPSMRGRPRTDVAIDKAA